MPANLTPQYHEADKAFKAAATIEEKIVHLEEMLRLIPKHKGTDHMQADLKHKLSQLKKEQVEGKGKAKKSGPVFTIDKEGAGQIALLGAPNAGKSQVLAAVTKATPVVAEYPFSTHVPQPGMARFEDIQIQIIDTPPVTQDFFEPWMTDIVRRADVALLVADLGDDGLMDAIEVVIKRFEAVKIHLVSEIPPDADTHSHTWRRTVILANKLDLPDAADRLEILREYYGKRYDIWPVSAGMGTAMDALPARLFQFLRIIRVYTKEPGKKADMERPYTIPAGSNVVELAVRVHREFEHMLKSARVWGSGKYDGIHVKRDHMLMDKDVVELQVGG